MATHDSARSQEPRIHHHSHYRLADRDDGSRDEREVSWKLFTYAWTGATPGEHTLVSRVTDVKGNVQPTEQALENKKTFLEDNSQFPRKVKIS